MKLNKNCVYKIADTIQRIILVLLAICADLLLLCGVAYMFYCKEFVLGLFLLLIWILITLQIIKDLII